MNHVMEIQYSAIPSDDKYIPKQVSATEITNVISAARDKFARKYAGQLGIGANGACDKIEAADEIFTELFNEINKTFQA